MVASLTRGRKERREKELLPFPSFTLFIIRAYVAFKFFLEF
jgi:hypothetical protein